ncbi:hypothetical protein IWQ60_010074, partial [Tieghemiomyces parasiticus]
MLPTDPFGEDFENSADPQAHFRGRHGDLPSDEIPTDWESHLEEPVDPTLNDSILDQLQVRFQAGRNYYTLLNVSRQASDEQIRESYRRLCLTFHPDRQVDPEVREVARTQFENIQRAYDVLSDPRQRAIYDTLGEAGLGVVEYNNPQDHDDTAVLSELTVGHRIKTPDELRQELERRLLQMRREKLHQLLQSKGELQVHIDATKVFNALDVDAPATSSPPTPAFMAFPGNLFPTMVTRTAQMAPPAAKKAEGPIPLVQGQGCATLADTAHSLTTPVRRVWQHLDRAQYHHVSVAHSFLLPLGERVSAVLRGQIGAGTMSGHAERLTVHLRHHVSSQFLAEYTYDLTRPHQAQIRTTYVPDMDFTVFSQCTLVNPARPPVFRIDLNRRLDDQVMMSAGFNTGIWSVGSWGRRPAYHHPGGGPDTVFNLPAASTLVAVSKTYEDTIVTAECQAGLAQSYVRLQCSRPVVKGIEAHGGMTLGNREGAAMFVGSRWDLTRRCKMSLDVVFGYFRPLQLEFRFDRLGQSFFVPVVLEMVTSLRMVVGAVTIPTLAGLALYHCVILPRRRRQLALRLATLRYEYRASLAHRRAEALATQDAIRRQADQKCAAEREVDGLEIVEAHYGNFDKSAPSDIDATTTDPSSTAALAPGPADGNVFDVRTWFRHKRLRDALNIIPLSFLTGGDPGTDDGAVAGEDEEENGGWDADQSPVVDVTVPLQYLVNHSKLVLPGNATKADLVGFFDPCFGRRKQLRVTYRFNRQLHTVTIDDLAPLACPLR